MERQKLPGLGQFMDPASIPDHQMDHLKGGRQGQIAVVALDREVERTYPLGMLHHAAGNRTNSNSNGSWPTLSGAARAKV